MGDNEYNFIEDNEAGIIEPEQPRLNGKKTNKNAAAKKNVARASRKVASKKKRKIGNSEKSKLEWNFPKHTLEETIEIAKAIEEKNGGNLTDATDLAKMVGFKNPDWRFTDLLRSANFYGIVEGKGATAKVTLTSIGNDIVAPSSPNQRQNALLNAFRSATLFKEVSEYYQGKKIPEDEYFSNTLAKNFNINRERISTFIDVFQKNLNFLKAFAADKAGAKIVETPSVTGDKKDFGDSRTISPERPVIREFLDTCFILMPFVDWYDKYFNELYVPATKEAGFEPIRADGLFSTGSVMEQIWEQIQKAKVLLADLTGKNANVFYELGLAHAIGKPVILVTGNLDDVPFDLRHLRVIVYDIRVPDWGETLKKYITSYLKNAKSEPEKSIPQPYRHLINESK